MSLWGRIFALLYDRGMAPTERAGLGARRDALLAEASGSVVEIGAGTGVNVPRYGAGVTDLVLCEPEAPMASRLRARLAAVGNGAARVIEAPAEALPLPDGSADVAVATLVLCTVGDPRRALAELRRVLKPGGKLLFIEHVRSDDAATARLQDRWAPLWRKCGHGCTCNRATLQAITDAGFAIERVEHGRLPKAPKIVKPMIAGVAVAPQA